MLHWVGKRPLDTVSYYPAQLSESVNVEKPPREPTYREFIAGNYNLLFHGDNKEILSSLLIAGFRGKIDLIYIDPPFDSGVDYVRKVQLRGIGNGNGNGNGGNGNGNGNDNGSNGNGGMAGSGHTAIEQTQYEDIWANDNYLQFMFERLILIRELLSDKGSIYLHCDEHKSHQLRFLLDEVFGQDSFKREIVWDITVLSGFKTQAKNWIRGHDSIFYYTKEKGIFNKQLQPHTEKYLDMFKQEDEGGKFLIAHGIKRYLNDVIKKGKPFGDVWDDIMSFQQQPTSSENFQYPTQKPSTLLERIIKASSNKDSIVLDCFCGSGTTAAAAEKLGRRWIMADLNKGAIQTTIKRLQGIVKEKNGNLAEKNGGGLIHYRVNHYDFPNQNALKQIIVTKYGIQKDRQDLFFDGMVGEQLAKIIDLNKPLTRLDIQIIKDELAENRPEDPRDITVFCNGSELGIIQELAQSKNPINKITVCDIQQAGMITNQPAEADVTITKKGKTAYVKINEYISPSILARLEIDRTIFDEHISDFRAQIDCVLIDSDYTGKYFNIVKSDLPERKKDFVAAQYEIPLPRPEAKVAVKIVDMLGEEIIIVE